MNGQVPSASPRGATSPILPQRRSAEALTGKGHITGTVGNEDRATIQIPLVDQK